MRGRIAGLIDRALRESGARGALPTPLDRITAMLGLELVEVAGLRPGVLGALLFEERLVFVDGRSPSRAAASPTRTSSSMPCANGTTPRCARTPPPPSSLRSAT